MNKVMNRAAALALLLLFVFSQGYLIAGSFGIRVGSAAPLWILALCVSVWLADVFRHGIFLSLPLSAGLLYGAYRFYSPELSTELADVLDRLAGAYYEHFYAPDSSYVYANSAQSHDMVFIFFAFLIASYMITALTSKSARISLSLLGSVPLFAFCIGITGHPDPLLIVGMLLFWVLLLVGGSTYDEDSAAWRSVLGSAVPCALLLTILLMLKPPSEYSYTDEDVARVQRLGRIAAALMGKDGYGAASPEDSGSSIIETPAPPEPYALWRSDNGMALNSGYSDDADDAVFLRVKSDSEGYIYLRGSSYGDYSGTGWLSAQEPEQSSSLDFAALAAEASGGAAHKLELRYIAAADAKFIPYYSVSGSPSDIRALYGGGQAQTVEYRALDTRSAALPPQTSEAEAAYRPFAHDFYTRLPERTRSAMLSLAAQAGLDAGSDDIVSQVAEYIRSAGEYDLSTPSYPSDDVALYFLTQAKRGYCIHFASAAAAMYRALGIPARVTEGFLFYARQGKWTDVTGANAHAWVEVYEDGLGWIPVEVTAASSDQSPADTPSVQTLPPEESLSPDSPPPPETSTPSPADRTDISPPAGVISGEPSAQRGPAPKPFPWAAAAPVIALAAAAAAVFLRRRLMLGASRKKRGGRDGNLAAIELWRVCEKLARYGAETPPAVRVCAEKAVFSPHTVSREEIKACRALVSGLAEQTYAPLSLWKKLRFKYFDCIM